MREIRDIGVPPPLPPKDNLVQQMRTHVASYKSLSPHRRNCLALCDLVVELEATIERYETALNKLSRLGNEPQLGNSDGNRIAQDALGYSGVGDE